MANNYASDIADGSLQHLLLMESAAITVDSSGLGNTMTNNNNVVSDTTHQFEGTGCADFERDNHTALSIIDSSLSAGYPFKSGTTNKIITLCLRAKLESLVGGDTNVRYIYGKYDISSKRSFAIVQEASLNKDKAELLLGYNSGNSRDPFTFGTAFVTGRYYSICAQYNDTTKKYLLRIYDHTASAFLGADVSGTWNQNIYVAAAPVVLGDGGWLGGYNYDGLIDELAVWNKTLSSDQLNAWIAGTYGTAVTLTVADAAHALASESPALVQAYLLAPADAAHALTSQAPALIQDYLLAPADAAHALTSQVPALVQDYLLSPADGAHALGSDSPGLIQAYTLTIADAAHALISQGPALIQAYTLTVANAAHALTSESPSLDWGFILTVADAVHGLTSESPRLVQDYVLVPADAVHAPTSQTVTLIQDYKITVADAAHALASGSPIVWVPLYTHGTVYGPAAASVVRSPRAFGKIYSPWPYATVQDDRS